MVKMADQFVARPSYSDAVGNKDENGALLLVETDNGRNAAGERKVSSRQAVERGGWTGKADFMMSLIAYAIGLGNVWRFPYLCFKNGGGAFLVPYFLCWLIAATPIFFMEVSIGQFLGEGGISVWKLCPIFKGVGIANNIIACLCNIYYCVIVCWAMFYVISSFTIGNLPWQGCAKFWTDPSCWDPRENFSLSLLIERGLQLNETDGPVTQFWEKRVLKTTRGIEETGVVQWQLALLLLLVWVMTYFALWKGITNSRKLVYFCAISPYVLLFILLGRGLSLDGAMDGVKLFLKPNASKLLEAEVWKDAGTQIFYSSGIGFGTLVALGSLNNYHHNVYRDALTLCCINSCTSITAGLVVFSVLGYMAGIAGKKVGDVVKSGVGLAFLVYPEAISTLPIAPLWSILFFLMITILGLDSQSGQFWLTLVDAYGASGITLLFVVFFEIVGLSWGFGADRIYRALEDMLGFRPFFIWKIFWKFTAPLICVTIFVITIYDYRPLTYSDKVTPYPTWAMVLGFLMSALSMLMIPLYAIYYLIATPGKSIGEKLRSGVTPAVQLRYEKHESDSPDAGPILRHMQISLPKVSSGSNRFEYTPRYSDMPLTEINQTSRS